MWIVAATATAIAVVVGGLIWMRKKKAPKKKVCPLSKKLRCMECDYLIVGGGAMGMAFADIILSKTSDKTIIMVDRHSSPGNNIHLLRPSPDVHNTFEHS